jgi:Domain of unknown function (DUF4262)
MPLNNPEFSEFRVVRTPRLLEEHETHLHAVRNNIANSGWHVAGVFADPGRLGWTYTVGLNDTIGVDDLVVFGLSYETAGTLLNDVGDELIRGRRFEDDVRYPGFLEDVDIKFRPTLAKWGPAHFGRARDWYGHYPVVRQIVIPDLENRFPGEPECEATRFQLLLDSDDPAPNRLTHPTSPLPKGEFAFDVIEIGDIDGGHPTGYVELVQTAEGVRPDRRVVVSVPFTDHLAFGDELLVSGEGESLRFESITEYAPTATVRVGVLRNDPDVDRAIDDLIADARTRETLFESPVSNWLFFAVPHHQLDWFLARLAPLREQRFISSTVARRPN